MRLNTISQKGLNMTEYDACHFSFHFKFPDGSEGYFDYCAGDEVSPEEAEKIAMDLKAKYESFGFTEVEVSEF